VGGKSELCFTTTEGSKLPKNYLDLSGIKQLATCPDQISHQVNKTRDEVWGSKTQAAIEASIAALAALTAAEKAVTASKAADEAADTAKNTIVTMTKLFHERLCHVSTQYMKAFGFKDCLGWCMECSLGKASNKKQNKLPKTTVPPYNYHTVHIDLCGPFSKSEEGFKYVCGITCGKSSETKIYPIRRKSDAILALKKYIRDHNLKHRVRMRIIQCDGGGEFGGDHLIGFKNFATHLGIQYQVSAPHNQAQNGKIERKWRNLKDATRIVLHTSKRPVKMWPYAMATVNYVQNRSPHKANKGMSPYECITGKSPEIAHMRKWGCPCVVKKPGQQGLELKGRTGIFVGYSAEHANGTYLVRMDDTKRLIVAKSVYFNENRVGKRVDEAETHMKGNSLYDDTTLPTRTSVAQADKSETKSTTRTLNSNSVGVSDDRRIVRGPKTPSAEYIKNRISTVVNLTSEEAKKTTFPNAKGKIKRYGQPDLIWDLNHGYLKFQDGESALAADILSDQLDRDKHMLVTVQTHRNEWENVESEETCMLVDTTSKEPETYSRNSKEPRTIKEAMKMSDRDQWKQAVKDELNTLIDMGTWKLVPLPKGRKAVGCRMVLKRKFNLDGTVSRWKARAVLKGYAQREHIDYEETFAPVGKLETFRYLMALANRKDWNLRQIDFKNAFLNAKMDKELYMDIPPGMEFLMDLKTLAEGTVCKLIRGLYGAKQSPALWNKHLDEYLRSIGFQSSTSDPCLYVATEKCLKSGKADDSFVPTKLDQGHDNVVYILAYVDDCVITGTSNKLIEMAIDRIKSDFVVEDLGNLHHFLGMEVIRDRKTRTLEININKYILDVLERFNMTDANGRKAPMASSNLTTKLDCPNPETKEGKEEIERMKNVPYRQLLGALLWIHRTGAPSIAYPVHHLCMFSNNPGEVHWRQAQVILKYLKRHVERDNEKGIIPLGLKFHHDENLNLEGYVDASFADNYGTDEGNRRSTTGWCFKTGGSLLSWKAHKQSTVATSTAEAEYIAAYEATKEAIYLKRIGIDLGILDEDYTVTLHEDSQACIKIAENPCLAERTKHFDIKYHWLREQIKKMNVKLSYINTHDQLADIFTKPLGFIQHNLLKNRMTGYEV